MQTSNVLTYLFANLLVLLQSVIHSILLVSNVWHLAPVILNIMG